MTTPSRRHWLTAAVAAGGAAAGLAGWWWPRRQASPQADSPAAELWPLRLAKPGGGELALADFRGRRLVLNFWATWCPPCVKELPDLETFAAEQGAAGWQVLALAIDSPSAVAEFLQRLPLKLPVGVAGFEGTTLTKALGNAHGSLPFTVLIGTQGQIVHRHLGQTSLPQLREWAKLADS